MSNQSVETASPLSVEELRAIFLRPDHPLKLPDDSSALIRSLSSLQNEVAIAEHECADAPDQWVELWAIPNDGGHEADRWYVDWRITNDNGDVILECFSFCPFCGMHLDDQIDSLGYYKYVGHDLEAEIAAEDARSEREAQL